MLDNHTPRILIVDDEPHNLEIVSEYLSECHYEIDTAEDGVIALEKLEQNPDAFDVVLLDRMMPNMNGMEVLNRIKLHPVLKQIPVIFQTARAGSADMIEGMQAGAYYYLTKPFEEEMLLSIVKTAVEDRKRYLSLLRELAEIKRPICLMESGHFRFRTLEEGRALAALVASTCPKPQAVVMGLSELLINAVEHGNLQISYEDKTRLMETGEWLPEIERRLQLPENINKYVNVKFRRTNDEIILEIKDEGSGFNWRNYMEMTADRVSDNHGRGIAIAAAISFSHIEYHGCGNSLTAHVEL